MTPLKHRFAALLAGLMTLALMFAVCIPPAGAVGAAGSHCDNYAKTADGKTEICENHTDAFYVNTDSGKPVVYVRTGFNDDLYDPNSTVFAIQPQTYSDSYNFRALSRGGKVGYYSSGNRDFWFEPGWSAPNVKENGFTSVSIHFLKVRGPGNLAVFGNNELAVDENDPNLFKPVLKDGSYYVEDGSVLPVPGHYHGHWFFEKAGLYTLTAKAVAEKSDGKKEESKIFTVVFRVIKNPADTRDTSAGADPAPTPEVPGENPSPLPPAPGPQPSPGPAGTDPAPAPVNPAPQPGENSAGSAQILSPERKTVLDHGHIDVFNAVMRNGRPALTVKDDSVSPSVLREAESVIMNVPQKAYTEFPENFARKFVPSGYFLGINGDRQSEIPFPGWDSMSVPKSAHPLEYEFLEVKGPGKVFFFGSPSYRGSASLFESGNTQLVSGEKIWQPEPRHVHGNWIFEKRGIYTMKVRVSSKAALSASSSFLNGLSDRAAAALDANRDAQSSRVFTYTWAVGDGLIGKPGGHGGARQIPHQTHDSASGQDLSAGGNGNSGAAGAHGFGFGPRRAKHAVCRLRSVGGTGGAALLPRIKDDRFVPAHWVDPSSLTFAVGAAGKAVTTETTGNIPANTRVWMISASQVANVPWVGVNTQAPSLLEKTNGSLSMSLTSFSGPGMMEVFQSGNFGKTVGKRWLWGAGSSGAGTISLSPNTHAHPNWVFSSPGTYRVGLRLRTAMRASGAVFADTVLTFNVGAGAGVTHGHFDLGALVAAAGSTQKWLTDDGKPCVPSAAELRAAGMSGMGAGKSAASAAAAADGADAQPAGMSDSVKALKSPQANSGEGNASLFTQHILLGAVAALLLVNAVFSGVGIVQRRKAALNAKA